MDNFFSASLFYDLLNNKKINACGTAQGNWKDFPQDISQAKIKRGDIHIQYGQSLTALCWKVKSDVYMLISMHHPSKSKHQRFQ